MQATQQNNLLVEVIYADAGHEGVAHQFFMVLRQKWPQINEHTKIQYTMSRTVYAESPYRRRQTLITSIPDEPPTWRSWRRALYPSGRLDNPEKRWKYQQRVFKTLGSTFKLARLWASGKMKRDHDRYVKKYMTVEMPEPDVIELNDRFGWEMQVWPDDKVRKIWLCAYYPPHDVLYVYKW